ncbi:MAG: FHA domain-containing protein [Anaerolineae bacterium]|nr:FHA domain-containing protein [Anaerolineae bacterium]
MSRIQQEQLIELGPIRISKNRRTVQINKKKLSLPNREFRILILLVENYYKDEECVSYMEFANFVLDWPVENNWARLDRDDQVAIRSSFKTYKNNLTRKLEDFNLDIKIESVKGKGYRFTPPEISDTERAGSGQRAPDAMLSYDDSSIGFYRNLKESAAQFPLSANTHRWIIGRDQIKCDIWINHERVSGIHATIFQQDGEWFICDTGTYGQGSTHGTLIHSQETVFKVGIGAENAKLLRNGDLIQIAPALFYRFEEFLLP